MAGTMQGLWVFLSLSPVLMVLGSPARQFSANPANRDRFIGTGLWAWSRHHNYAGEILLRVGVFTVCAPVLWPRLWPKAPPT